VVTGCYAQRAPEELAAMDGVEAVVGNSHKGLAPGLAAGLTVQAAALRAFPDPSIGGRSLWSRDSGGSPDGSGLVPVSSLLRASGSSAQIFVDDTFAHSELSLLPFALDARQTRPNLKVQNGCGNRCSFCVIPATRGPSRSVSFAECVENVRRFAGAGGQEMVLSGINLGRWGRDLSPALRFVELVDAILRKTALPRLRLSSIEPMDWTVNGPGALLALYREFALGAHPRLAPHAHLPLQSGSDAILRAMHRRYRPWHYAERVHAIRAALPDAAIGADVMVGFPGETEALFRESYDFIAALPFTYLHLFPFSARPGTPGWEMHRMSGVHTDAVAERITALRALAEEKARAFRRRFIGRALSVVTLEGGDGARTPSLSGNFLKVELDGAIAANRMVEAHIAEDEGGVLIGARAAALAAG
jgi:threonylcarbamoyladenosine tRNA methylthiotransferase MtaB